jgi:hypothetical protein
MITTHQQETFLCRQTGCVKVDSLCQSSQRQAGDGLLCTQWSYYTLHCIWSINRGFKVSSSFVGLRIAMSTCGLWPTEMIHWNWFIWYTLASGLQCSAWHSKNLSSHSFYLRTECNYLCTTYTHHSKSPDLRGYCQSSVGSFSLLPHD